ncbi:MAG TPA: response regulator transcription factor [Spirochaetia bacterium]|nr:response regulator transcription factor [Spirochaetia bacterium]
MPPLVAIVDDEEHLRDTVSRALRAEGYRTALYSDGAEAWDAFSTALPDLAILDILMPRLDGLELCRRLRAASGSLPVMFLTSKDEEFDRVLGLELGADDYLCKPFSLRELAARVKVLFRRAGPRTAAGADREAEGDVVSVGPLTLDTRRFTAAWNGAPVRLTVTEFRILHALARQPGFVRTREQLLSEAFPHDSYMSDRTIDCHIRRIRGKIEAHDEEFDGIETLYGLGYRMRAD